MGASRKLQGEIDRVLKKVQEGVDVFDSIWNKVYDTDNVNQKEKFEADLKKEIKKLQRYRDQIKTWIQSSEIKDKKVSASYEQALVDARKTIEKEMERFKICEKETKTKAFSKEGLGQQPKTDPKEKAKSETRDWLNNVVGELESQIDSFEAEIEGLTVKKGKTRPPRLTHLEASITRHKLHIKKLELILRLLDNDELSPEQVNDVKDFLDDYVERNQEDFDDFSDVDDLYNSLPLDKVESLEDLVTIGPPGLVKGAPVHSLKTSLVTSAPQMPATVASTHHEGAVVQDQADDTTSQDSNSDIVARTPPAKSSMVGSSAASTPTGNHAPISVNVQAQTLPGLPAASPTLPGSSVLENAAPSNPSSPATLGNSMKEEEIAGFPGRRSSPSLADAGLARGIGRGGLSSQPSSGIPLSPGVIPSNGAHGSVPLASDIAKRNILGTDDRIGSAGMVQPLASPLSSRMILPQAGDGTSAVDTSSSGEAATMGGRVFSPLVTGMQWRPGSSFQNQNEPGQFRARTEIAPDQREKFLQRLQQVQQQGHSNILGMPPLTGGNHKQYSAQQNPLLQQASGFNTVTSAALQQPNSIHQQSSQQVVMSSAVKDAELGHSTVEEQQLKQNLPEDSTTESALTSGLGKSLVNEDELTSPYAMDTSAGASGSLTEPLQVPRDIDLSPGQPLQSSQPSSGLGVIGRRSVSDLGAIGDNLTGSAVNSGAMHNQLYNLQMLEAAYHKLPQPKDSERARSYIPRHPAATPPSYPQVQLPMASNPAFWERLSMHSYGTDTLFFAFYYQQNTYQQYLAAKELKKQSWRYHRKYNTWFQRHEEPKVTTDEYEQGTYVYFDFHVGKDDKQGWCQRIKTEFTFEYNYLEDELIV
ncbi:PREDICTED: general negative regulator of transcription subunit 3 isoform X2 [Populus euphratica]|uniref:General negative regulator of transcription subunit 3 isoform X2 n=1 Tax=Populus euphratica TaxID=75702 RepID=A0AAJ6USA1_POPEU|nr:PREDICTED: general negative regulator of transcription subunit 3 isoform X2 [Populus euphratica]